MRNVYWNRLKAFDVCPRASGPRRLTPRADRGIVPRLRIRSTLGPLKAVRPQAGRDFFDGPFVKRIFYLFDNPPP